MGSRSMTVGRYEEIRRRLDEGRGGHETFMRELRSGFAIAQRQALTTEAKAERLASRLTQEQARVQERQAQRLPSWKASSRPISERMPDDRSAAYCRRRPRFNQPVAARCPRGRIASKFAITIHQSNLTKSLKIS